LQIHKLSYIRTRVGQCRAWLRFSLNEAALTSYLSSLLHTTEYKSLVSRYYDGYALFRDPEQVMFGKLSAYCIIDNYA